MGEVTTIKQTDRLVPQKDSGEAFGVSINYAIASALALNADTITLLTFQRDGVLFGGRGAFAGTLGASATARFRLNDGSTQRNLAAASTAGGADEKVFATPMRFVAGEKLEILVGGANIAAATTLQVDLLLSHHPVQARA